MRRFVVPGVIAAIAVVFIIVLATAISGSGANNSIAYSVQHHKYKPAPGAEDELVSLTDAKTKQSLASFHGKLVLVNFFAGWCGPCAEEVPELTKAQQMLGSHNGTVVGVTYKDGPGDARDYLKKSGLSYPAWFDAGGTLASAFGVTGPPENFLIDRQGKIVWDTEYQLTPNFVTSTLPQLIKKYA